MNPEHERGALASLGRWLRGHVPTREGLGRNRYIRPFAHKVLRSELWRFTRRSVPRGVALGIFLGVTIPFAHSFFAAILAVFVRANVPVAIAATWVSNPFTWPLMWPLAYRIGRFLLHIDAFAGIQPVGVSMGGMPAHHHPHMLHQLANAGLAAACGLAVEGVVLATLGYFASSVVWRIRVTRRRRSRLRRFART